jgi:hypothetical protein
MTSRQMIASSSLQPPFNPQRALHLRGCCLNVSPFSLVGHLEYYSGAGQMTVDFDPNFRT